MIKIDENGNKVYSWVEEFIDDTTNKSVLVERYNVLVEKDDKEHWMSSIDADNYEDGGIYWVELTIYAENSTICDIKQLVDKLFNVYGRNDEGEESSELLGLEIPLKCFYEALEGDNNFEGFVQGFEIVEEDKACIKIECNGENIVPIKNALFKAFPDIEFIDRNGYRIE